MFSPLSAAAAGSDFFNLIPQGAVSQGEIFYLTWLSLTRSCFWAEHFNILLVKCIVWNMHTILQVIPLCIILRNSNTISYASKQWHQKLQPYNCLPETSLQNTVSYNVLESAFILSPKQEKHFFHWVFNTIVTMKTLIFCGIIMSICFAYPTQISVLKLGSFLAINISGWWMSFISELLFYMQFLLTLPNLLISIKIFQTFLYVNLILIKARLEETEKGKK